MKKLLFGLFALGTVSFCNAQTADKKEEVKFTPPVIVKDEPATKSTNTVKFSSPIIKKNKTAKKSKKAKFTPPVIVKDKSTK
jgi:hypothetical protein